MSAPVDILGREIAVGNYIAWPTVVGSSGNMSLGQIVEFIDPLPHYYGPKREYRIKVKPLKSARDYKYHRRQDYVPEGFVQDGQVRHFRDNGKGVRPVILTNIENVLKVDVPVEDAYSDSVR